MAATFEPNREGILAAFSSETMFREMERRAGRAKAFAEEISPVDTGRYRYGAFLLNSRTDPSGRRRRRARSNFEQLPENDVGGFHIERFTTDEGYAAARLFNPTFYAKFVEFGTSRNHAHHVLGKSLDALK